MSPTKQAKSQGNIAAVLLHTSSVGLQQLIDKIDYNRLWKSLSTNVIID